MKIYDLGEFPPEKNYKYYDYEQLHKIESNQYYFNKMDAEYIFYWYGTGDYCGVGQLLAYKYKKWVLESLNHCSCNGPLEDIWIDNTFVDRLEDIKQMCSEDLLKEVKPLINLANIKIENVCPECRRILQRLGKSNLYLCSKECNWLGYR